MLGFLASHASADESIVNFWRPGQLGSMAAVPGKPGWLLPIVYIHLAVGAKDSRDLPQVGHLDTDVQGRADLVFFIPTYTFERPLWGGRPSLGLGIGGGRSRSTAEATLTMPWTGAISGAQRDAVTGLTDIYPTANVKWNQGANNFMVYASGVLPVGSHRQSRLANTGAKRWAMDAGAGYTYFDLKQRMEFSVVGGMNYKARNPDSDYRSGAEAHVDWATSYFLWPNVHAGLAGYFYRQLKGDSGSGAVLGTLKSRVNGIGPQAGIFFEAGGQPYYLNAKAYKEWGARNRAEGWNFWLTLVMPFSAK
jgi:hypothetical protein